MGLESMVDSVPSANGKNLNEKSLNGMQESLERFNESHEKELNNALNIIAHNDNSFVNELAINKNGKPLSEAGEEEINEAAAAFDKLYGSVTKVALKYYHARGGASVITQMTINGEKVTDIKVGVVKKAAANQVPPVNNPADNEIIENNIIENKINSYGNLSLNDIKTKAAETREEFKNTEVFRNGWQKPQFEYMLKVAEAQRKIQKKMEKVNKTAVKKA